MARLESVAIGGYFKTPTHLLPRIVPLLAQHHGEDEEVVFMDPCAGDGEAIITLCKAWSKARTPKLYVCEMEQSRVEAFKERVKMDWALGKNLLHGDAFNITFRVRERGGVSVLFLNPPYDTDPQHGRLEHKFLARFAQTLAYDGVLLFVVPHYALGASADFLATEFSSLQCFKFPDEDFKAFKQVVLVAQKCPTRLAPDARIADQIRAWARDVSDAPDLPHIAAKPLFEIPSFDTYTEGLSEWVLRPVDVSALAAKARPWKYNTRSGSSAVVHGVLPDLPIEELLLRKYPVATPPRPAHIAAGIASGIFNGSRVEATTEGLPPLLVKGVFDQEWRTVEEKSNKHGDVTGVVQVQQPRLVTTVLDLSTHQYHTLGQGPSVEPSIEGLTVAGLLQHYGDSLMQVMEQQCPILYDPRKDGNTVPLAETDRDLYHAQQHATKALVKLLGGPGVPLKKRKGKGAILLGEIGSGKTSVALALGKTIASKRPLVVCPPHLLDGWRDELGKVLGETEYRVLGSIKDLEDLAADDREDTIVSVVSRETAKLSHGWIGVHPRCPKCGARTPVIDLAKKRARCEAKVLLGSGVIASAVSKLARQLLPYDPTDSSIRELHYSRWDRVRVKHYTAKHEDEDQVPPIFPGFVASYFDAALKHLVDEYPHGNRELAEKAIVWMLLSVGDPHRIAKVAEYMLEQEHYYSQDFGRSLLLMLPPNHSLQIELVQRFNKGNHSYGWNSWDHFASHVESCKKEHSHIKVADIPILWKHHTLVVGGCEARSYEAAHAAVLCLCRISGMKWSDPCGEILYQAVPEPRRVSLAHHIFHRYPKLFDFLVLDEAHEYGTEGSAQQRAGHRLAGLGMPTLLMTGSLMNGYAESLFMNMWAISADFRREFRREDKTKFIQRYGYLKRLVSERDSSSGEIVAFGSMSDRVTRSERIIGNAPGVLPLFLLRHLLPIAVTLHKADLALDLPPCVQERFMVDPGKELRDRYESLKNALVARIRKDQFTPELAGKLFGQLAEFPSYLDRATADTGNTEEGDYVIRYPESVGSEVVVRQEPLDASEILPKEEWMLDTVEKELSEGRNVMIFSWHVVLLPRLARLIEERIGVRNVPILYAKKVATGKRQDWINKQVVKNNASVMLANPVAIQTGLNNLVHFATEIWMENPACNPIIFRQATGRVDRIGQNKTTRIFVPVYKGTLQEQLYDLLLQKVAVSVSTDGLDPESALLAAGIGTDEYMTGLSIGKQLWAMLSDGFIEPRKKMSREATPILDMV